MDASSVPAGRAESEPISSSQRGAVDASSVPIRTAESNLSAASISGTDQGNGDNAPAVLPGRAVHELSDWGRPPVTVRDRTRGQIQRLQG